EGVQEQLPVKAKKAKQRRKSYLSILIKNNQGQVVIEKRPDTGLLANLWRFSMAPVKDVMDASQWLYQEYGLDVILQQRQVKLTHVFSHIIWELEIYDAVLEDSGVLDERLQLVEINQLNEYPFPVSHQKMMKYL